MSDRPHKKRRASETRRDATIVNALAIGFHGVAETRWNQDFDYTVEMLHGAERDLVGPLAVMLQKGSLRKALGLGGPEVLDPRGKPLAASTKTFKALKDLTLYQMLCAFAPSRITMALLEGSELTKQDCSNWVTFALGESPAGRLPSVSPDLRFDIALIMYCVTRYNKLGRRLKDCDLRDPSSVGYFGINDEGKAVALKVPHVGDTAGNPTFVFNQISVDGDWDIRNNFSHDATLFSENEAVEIKLVKRFRAAGFGILSDTEPWDIPVFDWPECVKARPVSGAVAAAPLAQPALLLALPEGSGSVAVPR